MVKPSNLLVANVRVSDRRHNRANVCIVVLEGRLLVRLMEVIDSLGVGLQYLGLRLHEGLFVVSIFFILAFDAHNAHEIVSGVAELRASEINGGKVVN